MAKQLSLIVALLFCFHFSKASNLYVSIDSTSKDSGNVKVTCSEKLKRQGHGLDPIITKTCFLKNFKLVSIGEPDYKGRYSYEYEVYKKENKKFVPATNSEIFNANQEELLTLINKQIQADYKQYSTDSQTKDCFIGIDSIPFYKMNELGISFYGDQIWFNVTFGLSSACMSVDGTIVSFKLSEIKKYLN
ncbi:hypothetical protein [Ferruginibacter albus]|uniref:hypothetical protein n=1 Tax=Ferruginibacter albus TaxID=2875540 RepID=UPI001CC7F856|nr:hypothetical protein [Ferruginibacter albus]UAY53544.1 hypothetical protein K9M53_07715 [Ferruginibacter albus]